MSARILLIEDNATNLELMVYLLQAYGYSPVTALDGEAGIEIAQREQPDLILCDIGMAEMDGYAVAAHLRNEPELCEIPLVAVTALAMVGDRDRILAAGFDGYIAKPIDPEVFVPQVQAFLPGGQHLTHERRPAAEPAAVAGGNQPTPISPKRATILAVDDTPSNLNLLRSILEPSGYEVIGVPTVDDALKLAEKCPPDLILADVHMPNKNGFDLILAAKTNPVLDSIPFIFLSSTGSEDDEKRQGIALGADLYIVRPIEPEALLAEIESCLNGGDDRAYPVPAADAMRSTGRRGVPRFGTSLPGIAGLPGRSVGEE